MVKILFEPVIALMPSGQHIDAVIIKAPFHQDFVDALKDIPSQDRVYRASDKAWIVEASWTEELMALADELFDAGFAERREKYWSQKIERLCKKYSRIHWNRKELRDKKIPDKDMLLLLMEQEHIHQGSYSKIYARCRQTIKDEYPKFAARVLTGKIKR